MAAISEMCLILHKEAVKVDKPATFFLFSILLLTMAYAFEKPGRKESS